MFDVSFAELSVIMLVALLLIGPEELPGVIRGVRKFTNKTKEMFKDITNAVVDIDDAGSLKEEARKINQEIKRIVDLEGKLQDTYDISDIMPDIIKARQDKVRKEES